MLRIILANKNMTLYQLEKKSGVSHSTLSDIYNEKINIDHCSILVMSKIAAALEMDIDSLYKKLKYDDITEFYWTQRTDWVASQLCHEVKNYGDLGFIERYTKDNLAFELFENGEVYEAKYLVCLLDYLCSLHNLDIIPIFNEIREFELPKVRIPESFLLYIKYTDSKISEHSHEFIPIFFKNKIIEGSIRDVV